MGATSRIRSTFLRRFSGSKISVGVLSLVLVTAAGSIPRAALADDCPNNPTALGVSRTPPVKASDFPLVGKINYPETLRLNDREVVLTFDDGPSAPLHRHHTRCPGGGMRQSHFLYGRECHRRCSGSAATGHSTRGIPSEPTPLRMTI
jgi:hypothetical protein